MRSQVTLLLLVSASTPAFAARLRGNATSTTNVGSAQIKYKGFMSCTASSCQWSGSNVFLASDVPSCLAVHATHGIQCVLNANFELKLINGKALYPNWQAIWNTQVPVMNQLIANGTVAAIFLGDELYCGGTRGNSLATWTAFANAVKASCPGADLWANECGTSLSQSGFAIPPGLDAISVDQYHMDGYVKDWVKKEVKEKIYEQTIYPKLASHQRVFLVPGSFSSKLNKKCDADCYKDMIINDIEDYTSWALSDPKVWGVVPWTWASCGAACGGPHFMDEIGTVALKDVQSAWTTAFDKLG